MHGDRCLSWLQLRIRRSGGGGGGLYLETGPNNSPDSTHLYHGMDHIVCNGEEITMVKRSIRLTTYLARPGQPAGTSRDMPRYLDTSRANLRFLDDAALTWATIHQTLFGRVRPWSLSRAPAAQHQKMQEASLRFADRREMPRSVFRSQQVLPHGTVNNKNDKNDKNNKLSISAS